MVGVVKRTTSITESVEEQDINIQGRTYSTIPENSSYLADPDYLIRQYFLDASPKQKLSLRKIIVHETKYYNSILKILSFSRQGDIKDAYDAGVDLLAEFNSLDLHYQAFQYLESISHLVEQSSSLKTIRRLEEFWEILTKGIACAYKASAEARLDMIDKISRASQRRLVKTAVIDAFVTIADDVADIQTIKNFLGRYTSQYEPDDYVRNYAQEAIEDLE